MIDGNSDDLGPFTRALAQELEADLVEWEPVPDLGASVARARELAPDFVRVAQVAEARESPLSLDRAQPWQNPTNTAAHWKDLAPFTEPLREHIEREIGSSPVVPVSVPVKTTIRSYRGVAYASVALAACAVLLFGAGRLVDRLDRAEEQRLHHAAVSEAADPPTRMEVEPRGRRVLSRRNHVAVGVTAALGGGEGETSTSGRAEEAQISEEDRVPNVVVSLVAPNVAAEPLRTRLRRLDARARRQWSSGELRAAERSFKTLIEAGGRRPEVELAYGDLFALLRQGGRGKAVVSQWKRYLRSFPRGRFAEDARAGLCHRVELDKAERCWSAYLDAHPRGTHSVEARMHLSASKLP
ncbi:MAG: hypothetical protein V3V08_00105 [Nannocystaceae bacterium]